MSEAYYHVWYRRTNGQQAIGMACKLKHETEEEFRRRVISSRMSNGQTVQRIAVMPTSPLL